MTRFVFDISTNVMYTHIIKYNVDVLTEGLLDIVGYIVFHGLL